MEVFTTLTTAWLTLQALPLLLTPRLIVSLTVTEPRRITDLETYLCRSFGLTLLVTAALILLLSNTLPLSPTATTATTTHQTPADSDVEPTQTQPAQSNPYAYPTLIITTFYHFLTAFYLYAQLAYTWNFAFTSGILGSGCLFCIGMWTILFAGEKGRRSKRTGADKRTSGFPFENSGSARVIRKDAKERDREREREREGKGEKRRSFGRTKSGRVE